MALFRVVLSDALRILCVLRKYDGYAIGWLKVISFFLVGEELQQRRWENRVFRQVSPK